MRLIVSQPIALSWNVTPSLHTEMEETMASGDNCQFGRDNSGKPDYTVIHWDCDEYDDGVITDINGKIVGRKNV